MSDFKLQVEYPIIAFIGDTGDGKTLSMTTLAKIYESLGYNIYANYTLYNIPYYEISFDILAEFPDWMHNGVVCMDEGHMGVDAYNFFSERNKNIVKFITQRRKRRLIFMYTTQLFSSVTRRLRDLTNYIAECYQTDIQGVIEVKIYDRNRLEIDNGYIKTITIDGRSTFDNYDTDQIID